MAQRLVYHSTIGSRVISKKKKVTNPAERATAGCEPFVRTSGAGWTDRKTSRSSHEVKL